MLLWQSLAVCLPLIGNVLAAPALDAPSENLEERNRGPFFYKGHDLSSLKILEDSGSIYKDTARHNKTRAAEDILGDGGMNTVRLRIWVNPPDGSYDLSYTLGLAKRFAHKGFKIYLDFHFSDTWADPQHNLVPTAWPTEINALAHTLRSYVSSTLISFAHAGVDLSLVSLGNEIRHGMLWPLGQADPDIQPFDATVSNFTNLATLYASARRGVDDAVHKGVRKPQVMIHIDNGWNITLQERWFGALTGSGKVHPRDWDVFGFSFYPFYGTSATLDNLRNSLHTLANKYHKPIQVVETDWPELCNGTYAPAPELSEPSIPISARGQTEWVQDIFQVVRGIPFGLGQGVHYWEPAWLNSTGLGSACEDAILFDADFSKFPQTVGYSRSSVKMFR
ncbi:MAG: hypothetical protein M4579_003412 [Chaenotheca gracillima]|nr:MAG: hypothetical protein M4579_003412 [Chaenotheca gracillima]